MGTGRPLQEILALADSGTRTMPTHLRAWTVSCRLRIHLWWFLVQVDLWAHKSKGPLSELLELPSRGGHWGLTATINFVGMHLGWQAASKTHTSHRQLLQKNAEQRLSRRKVPILLRSNHGLEWDLGASNFNKRRTDPAPQDCENHRASQTEKDKYHFIQFSRSVMSDSLWPHGLQHQLPEGWCYPTISSSVVTFPSFLWSFPASGSSPMS